MKRIAIITLSLITCFTGLCFADSQYDGNLITSQQDRTYYLAITADRDSIHYLVDYFAGDWRPVAESIIDKEMAKYGFKKSVSADSARYILKVGISQWGIVTMAEPGKVFQAAVVDATLDVFSRGEIIFSQSGSGEDTVVPEKQMVAELGRLVLEDLIYMSEWAISDYEAQLKSVESH